MPPTTRIPKQGAHSFTAYRSELPHVALEAREPDMTSH
jgi:hypothetical protein